MLIKVLGSISPYRKGTHNCSGYLVINGEVGILLDCGFGVSGELSFP